MDNKPIIFNIEDGIGVRNEHEGYKDSAFYEQYNVAFRIMGTICRNADTGNGQTASNVVAICGDRGEGKTSLLTSIKSILSEENAFEEACQDGIISAIDRDYLSLKNVKVLDVIDPIFFDDKHHLLELVLGQMYTALKSEAEQNFKQNKLAEKQKLRNDLMAKFQKVRQSMLVIHEGAPQDAYDKLEEIDDMSTGLSLKRNLDDLFEAYCDYFGKKRLVIMIDDLDLNATDGYQMVEEIRKYLSNPRYCLLVIALKVEQLQDVIMSYQRKKFEKFVSDEAIKDMAEKFIIKLLPESQRVIMPGGTGLVERELKIKEGNTKKETFPSVKEAVVWLIFRKTRFVFVNGRNLSPIVPTNLRELRTLVHLLWSLPDITRDESPNNSINKAQFKSYFYYTWTNILRDNDRKFIRELVVNEDLTSINKSVVQHLNIVFDTYYNSSKEGDKPTELFKQIVDKRNRIQNVSVGDVMYIVRFMESIATNKQDFDLLFFIKAFYSIKLYEAYDVISSDEAHLFVEEQEESSKYIYKYDQQLKKLNQLQRLLNGAYFTYEPGDLLPAKRDQRLINGKELRILMNSLPLDTEQCVGDELQKLQICEFFILTTTSPAYADKLENDRKRSSRSYYEKFTVNNGSIIFDALSIFYNAINIKFTYNRWDDISKIVDFYEYAKQVKDSLLNQLLEIHPDYKVPKGNNLSNPPHAFISDATIRISDVVFSILDNAENKKNVAKEGGNINNLNNLYSDIRELDINLYPLEDGRNDAITFTFLDPIRNLLDDTIKSKDSIEVKQAKESLNRRFNKIFDVSNEANMENTSDAQTPMKSKIAQKREQKRPFLEQALKGLFPNLEFPTQGHNLTERMMDEDLDLYLQSGDIDIFNKLWEDKSYKSFEELLNTINKRKLKNQQRLIDVYSDMNTNK